MAFKLRILMGRLYVVETALVTGSHQWGTALWPHADETSQRAIVFFFHITHTHSIMHAYQHHRTAGSLSLLKSDMGREDSGKAQRSRR